MRMNSGRKDIRSSQETRRWRRPTRSPSNTVCALMPGCSSTPRNSEYAFERHIVVPGQVLGANEQYLRRVEVPEQIVELHAV